MIKCIFTNIKNEHNYIEQWIEYHIRLGFNRFILFEDYDSRSHKRILNKYKNVTDIILYSDILKGNSEEFKDLTCFKYITNNYTDIDWLIKLDPDEYIIMPNKDTIDDMLYNIDEKYSQITLFWKFYTASGFITSPSKDKYDLISTYTKSIETSELNYNYTNNTSTVNNYSIGKSLVRYKYILDNGFYVSAGFPHYIIDVNNDNTLDGNSINVHINHYITKSFEEFYNKLHIKGEYNKYFHRKIGDFFIFNPDMIDKIPEIEKMFDVDISKFNTKLNIL